MKRFTLLAALVLLVQLVSASPLVEVRVRANADLPAPSVDPFYVNPSTVASASNGQVLKQRDVKTNINTPDLSRSFQVFYKTQNTQLQADGNVATVWVPSKPASPAKLFSIQVFEDSVNVDCAPSWAFVDGPDSTNKAPASLDTPIFIAWALSQGYYVVSPDHEGRQAAFIAGHQEGMATLDAIRAAKNALSLPADSAVVLYGYSGGAHATVWTENLAGSYAPDVNIVGSAHGGTPIDTRNIFNFLNGGLFSGFAGAGIVGLANAYPDLNDYIAAHLTPAGTDVFKKYRSSGFCLVNVVATYPLTNFLNYIDVPNALDQPIPAATLAKETLLQSKSSGGVAAPKFPRFFFHALPDEIVPYADEAQYVKEQCARGANIMFQTLPIAEHVTAEVLGIPGAILFIKQAFDGTTPKVVCGTQFPDFVTLLSPKADQIMGADLANQARALNGKSTPLGTVKF